MPGNLLVISSIANQLLEANAATATQASEKVLAQLVEHFDLHYSFLRHSDHRVGASVLAAEWPPRSDVADADPYAVVSFTSEQPALALCEDGKELVIYRGHESAGFRCPVTRHRFGGGPTVAAAPLVSGTHTSGVLGFVKCRGRKWKPEAIYTLETVASLFAQFQARIAAEERLRYLAEHDDLTGLRNRRALLAHLSDRLAARQRRPCRRPLHRSRPTESDQRLSRPRCRRLVHPEFCRSASRLRRQSKHGRATGRRRVHRRSG